MASLLRWISREDRDSLQRTKYSGKRSDDVRDDLPSTYFSEILRFEAIPAAPSLMSITNEMKLGESENFRFSQLDRSKEAAAAHLSITAESRLEGAMNFGDLLIYPESELFLDRVEFIIIIISSMQK